jgi:hypothetical protein
MKLYHVSETPDISIFHPKPSPQYYEDIKGNIVFAISETLLHNYLLPRDCPRVTFYAKSDSSMKDVEKHLGSSKYVVAVESDWLQKIKQTSLYLYELPQDSFSLLDEGAGYYISYKPVKPVSVKQITDLTAEINKTNAELRILPSIKALANEISKSTLQFSVIRMRNAV